MAKKKGVFSALLGGAGGKKKSSSRVAKAKPSSSKGKNAASKTKPKSKGQTKKPSKAPTAEQKNKKQFPDKFPFWARLKISKHRTTLVIDEDDVKDKKSGKIERAYVHREATHTYQKDSEIITPNPDKTDPEPMYLKRPSKLPKRMFEPHNKELDMPKHLEEKYSKNNK